MPTAYSSQVRKWSCRGATHRITASAGTSAKGRPAGLKDDVIRMTGITSATTRYAQASRRTTSRAQRGRRHSARSAACQVGACAASRALPADPACPVPVSIVRSLGVPAAPGSARAAIDCAYVDCRAFPVAATARAATVRAGAAARRGGAGPARARAGRGGDPRHGRPGSAGGPRRDLGLVPCAARPDGAGAAGPDPDRPLTRQQRHAAARGGPRSPRCHRPAAGVGPDGMGRAQRPPPRWRA